MELDMLPCLLIVVNKGKMGITYPRSLKYYDLRMRYEKRNQGTRACIEQDFGRACRYKSPEEDQMLPTILVSSVLKKILENSNKRKTRAESEITVQWKTSGLYNLYPDVNNKMRSDNNKGKKRDKDVFLLLLEKRPKDDHDLSAYSKYWNAGHNHFDYQNNEKCENRFLLQGRPQLGKTGVVLHLAFLIWSFIGKPQHTGPQYENISLEELELEEEISSERKEGEKIESRHCEDYPRPDHIESLRFIKPQPSLRYGDPNDPEVLEYYKRGAETPHESVLSKNNQIYKRTEVAGITLKESKNKENVECRQNNSSALVDVYSSFRLKPLLGDPQKEPCTYSTYLIPDQGGNLGKLHINLSRASVQHWNLPTPILIPNLGVPPIMIPSSGRSASSLLDLSEAMEKDTNYVQIVVLHHDDPDLENYKNLFQSYDLISFFVMDKGFRKKVGYSRCYALIDS